MFLRDDAKEVLKNLQNQIRRAEEALPNYAKDFSALEEQVECLLAKITQNENGRHDKW